MPLPPVPEVADDGLHDSLLVSAARSGMVGLFGSAVAALAGFALNIVVGRAYGPAASGVFFVTVAVVTVTSTLGRLGADTGMVWALPRGRELGRQDEARRTLLVAVVPVSLMSALAGVVVYLLSDELAAVSVSAAEQMQTAELLRIGVVFIALSGPMLVMVAGLRGAGRLVSYTLIQNVLVAGSRPVLLLLTSAAGLGLVAAVWAWGVPIAVALALALVLFARATSGPRTTRAGRRPAVDSAREFWRFSSARSVAALLEVAIVWADVLIVSAVVGSRQAGIYAAASRFVTAGTLVESAMRVALAAAVSARLAVGDLLAVARLHLASTQWIILLSWPLYIALAAYAPAVLRVFGPGFDDGATAMSLLCLAMLIAMATGNSQTVLLMSGRTGWQMMNKAVAIAVNLGLNLLLVPEHGIVGAAWAWTITILVDSAAVVLQVRYLVGVRVPAREVLRAVVVGAASFGAVGAVVRLTTDLSTTTVLMAVVVSSVLHLALLRLQRHHFNVAVLRESLRRRRTAAP